MSKKNKVTSDGVKVQGFFRLQINEAGKVVGDSGWKQNQVTNLGFDQYLCQTLAGMAGSKTVAYAVLGTGTVPGATATSLHGEITDATNMRSTMAVTPTTIDSKTVQFAFTLASNVITKTDGYTIQNVGLVNTSATDTGTIFAGNTFTTSALATNQSVEGTYQIRFA